MTQERHRDDRSNLEAARIEIAELRAELERERKKRRKAQSLATRDELTRLHNRRSFNTEGRPRFLRAKKGTTSVAMIFIDANGFKSINDTLGHTVGDALLVAIARAIKRSTRPSDMVGRGKKNLAGRKGGDEFVLFFVDINEAGAQIVTRRLYEAIRAIRLKRSPNVRAHVSIGVAVGVPPAGLEWKNLIAQADAAMYEAKKLKGTDRPTVCIRPLT